MKISEALSLARSYSRVSSSGASDSHVCDLINEGIRTFAIDSHGIKKQDYIQLAAKFTTETHFALRVTIVGGANALSATDVVITSTARYETTGTQVASDLQTALNAAIATGDLTVSWSNFYFTIDTTASSASTSITISSPTTTTYTDATEILGLSGSLTSSSAGVFTGGFPEDCTMEQSLSSLALSTQLVAWDDHELHLAPDSIFLRPTEASGTPYYYTTYRDRIRLYPVPTSQGILYLEYKGVPSALVFQGYRYCGLSSKSEKTETGLSDTTDYYFKVQVDHGPLTEYSITTATDTTYGAVVTLINADLTAGSAGATADMHNGCLRFRSDSNTGTNADPSQLELAVGTTGDDLFTNLTDFSASAWPAAVEADLDLPSEIPTEYQRAIPYWVAHELLMETHEVDEADKWFIKYNRLIRDYIANESNKHTLVRGPTAIPLGYKVEAGTNGM